MRQPKLVKIPCGTGAGTWPRFLSPLPFGCSILVFAMQPREFLSMNRKIILAALLLVCALSTAQQTSSAKPHGTAGDQAGNDSFGEPKCRQYQHETICRVGTGGVTPPKLIWPKTEPILQLDPSSSKCPCTALLWAVIEQDGHVRYPRVTRSLGPDLGPDIDRKIINYVHTWRFTPAHNRYRTAPVAVEVNFELHVR